MNLDTLWTEFLNRLQTQLLDITYNFWFKDTKLIELNNNTAYVLVKEESHKLHMKHNFSSLMEEIFNEVTGSNFIFEFVCNEDLNNNNIKVNSNETFNSGLDPKYSFENFIISDNNKFNKSIAFMVAEQPGMLYNPLFIYGKSGMGKTHLMHAIGNYVVKNSNKKVLYVTSEQYVDDFIKLFKKNKEEDNTNMVDNFKKKYRDLDVLIIDDIQYLEIANKTQQEFFNTFNELHKLNKQIIIASDRSPDDLKKLEERITTRFNWGITLEINPPDYEARCEIIKNKVQNAGKNFIFPQESIEYIANNCTSDVRKLEGAVTRVCAYATIFGYNKITYENTIEALKDFFTKQIISKNKIDKLMQIVSGKYNISVEDLKGKKRNSNITNPRQLAMYIARVYIKESLPKIGSEFGGKDHTTVMHSVDKIKKEIKTNKQLESEILDIVSDLNVEK